MDVLNEDWRAQLLHTAIIAIEADQPAVAEAPCATLLAADPGDVDAQLLLGLVRGLAGDAIGAAIMLDNVRRLNPDPSHACHTLVALLRQHGRTEAVGPQ